MDSDKFYRKFFIVEILIIIAFGLLATHHYLNFDPGMTLHGREAQWLTSSAQWVAQNLREVGYVPYWQPYLSRGVPALEDAFSFAFNPVAILPSVVFGYPNGIKLSIVLSTVLGGIGGLAVGYVLGLGFPARCLLGLLLMVRGPTYAVIATSQYQLGVSQFYFPWVVAAAIAVGRYPKARWTPFALAASLALLFLNGNIYYILPTVFTVIVILLFYLSKRSVVMIRKALLAFILTFGLAAVAMLPVLMTFSAIGRHPNDTRIGLTVDFTYMVAQVFDPQHFQRFSGTWHENYYIYTMPLWFGFFTLIILPLVMVLLPRYRIFGERWRIWVAGIMLFVFFGLWGTGSNPLIVSLYKQIPLLAQWRVAQRMLTLAGFWICVFAALNVNQLWYLLQPAHNAKVSNYIRVALRGILIIIVLIAPLQIIATRYNFGDIVPENAMVDNCVSWLRRQYPDKVLTVFTRDYFSVTTFIRNRVRLSHINADYDLLGTKSTIFPYDLTEAVPEYMIPYSKIEREYWIVRGYLPVFGSPPLADAPVLPCLWRNTKALAYAFTIPSPLFASFRPPRDYRFPIDATKTTPIEPLHFAPGKVVFRVANPTETPVTLVVQEIAWQGWTVSANGQPAQLESVGQLIGVILPAETPESVIVFEYTAPLLKLGGLITIITGIGSIIYLLRGRAFQKEGDSYQ